MPEDNTKLLVGVGIAIAWLSFYIYQKRTKCIATLHQNENKPSNPFTGHPSPKEIDQEDYIYLTKDELREYDGLSRADKKIFIAIKYDIFDVTENKGMYGEEGSYKCFSGREATIAMAKNSLKPNEIDKDFHSTKLNEEEKEALESWYDFFKGKYSLVGKVVEAKK